MHQIHCRERTQDGDVQTSGLVYLIQDSLRKHNFDIRTNKLQDALLQRDASKYVSKATVFSYIFIQIHFN